MLSRLWTLLNSRNHGHGRPDLLIFGDSNALVSYYPPWSAKRWPVMVGRERRWKIANYARNGGTARALLDSRHLARALSRGARRTVIAFGINDQKTRTPDEFRADLTELVQRCRAAGVTTIWLLTTVYLDYPAHYPADRDTELFPYNQAIRSVARNGGAHLIDVNRAQQHYAYAMDAGWDIRLRSRIRSKPYSNVHYNQWGCEIVASCVIAEVGDERR